MKKTKVSFRAPDHIVSRIIDLKNRKGFKNQSETYNFILKEYFRLSDEGIDEPSNSQDKIFFKSIIEDLDRLKSDNDTFIKLLLIIGSQDDGTKEAIATHFPQYFKKSS